MLKQQGVPTDFGIVQECRARSGQDPCGHKALPAQIQITSSYKP